MKKITETPITTESTWQERALKAEAQVELLVQEIGYLRAQMRLLQTKQFGSRSEKTHKDQMQLYFNEAEASAEPSASEAELVTVHEHKRAKKKSKKGQSLEGLPENIIEHNLPEEELTCTCCGHKRHVIRQEITRELRYVPAEVSVDVHVQNLYSCRHCESHGDGSTPVVVAAPKPQRAFPGSIASLRWCPTSSKKNTLRQCPFTARSNSGSGEVFRFRDRTCPIGSCMQPAIGSSLFTMR